MDRKSIMASDLERCILCGSRNWIDIHHVMNGNPNRKYSEEDGLIVPLCRYCHESIHKDAHKRYLLKAKAQAAWISYYNKTNEEWKSRYGKYYL